MTIDKQAKIYVAELDVTRMKVLGWTAGIRSTYEDLRRSLR